MAMASVEAGPKLLIGLCTSAFGDAATVVRRPGASSPFVGVCGLRQAEDDVEVTEDKEDIDVFEGDPGWAGKFNGSWNTGGDGPVRFPFLRAPSSDMVVDRRRVKSLISSRKDLITACESLSLAAKPVISSSR
jgi:hypothetical protein